MMVQKSKAEIDILMDNGNYVLLIETKYRLGKKHINSFKKKIIALQKYTPDIVKGKKILTAFGAMGINKALTKTFNDAGHYVITAKNNRIHISSPMGMRGLTTQRTTCKKCGTAFIPEHKRVVNCKKCRR